MIDLHVIGCSEDASHIVLDSDPDASPGRFRLAVDDALFTVLAHVRGGRDDDATDGETAPGGGAVGTAAQGSPTGDGAAPAGDGSPAEAESRESAGGASPERSALSPAEIQALLRAGRSPRSVAKAAGTAPAWVERWLPPILAERHQVLEDARATRLSRPRQGASRQPLGEAVATNLAARGVDPADATWTASRRKDGRWTVGVRFRQRNRQRSASWVLDRASGDLTAASALARDLGWSAARRRGGTGSRGKTRSGGRPQSRTATGK